MRPHEQLTQHLPPRKSTPDDIEIITTLPRLTEVVEAASRRSRVAVDIESNGFHRYPERVCLIQFAMSGSAFLIDPLAVSDLEPLGKLLADPSVEKVFHSADYDLRSLDRDWGFHVQSLFDTSIAASFLGSEKLGLGAVIEEYLGIKLIKEKRLQRADWTKRPLSDEARQYAADDVYCLEAARTELAQKLTERARIEWVMEECERLSTTRYEAPDRKWAFASIKGSGTLDGRGLSVLRSLYIFREHEAIRRDRPPFKVIANSALLSLAENPQAELAKIKGLGRFGHSPDSSRLRIAIREGLGGAPVSRPKRSTKVEQRLSAAERDAAGKHLQELKKWRAAMGRHLELDPSLLWPTISLERLSRRPDGLEVEMESTQVRVWQRQQFAESLRRFLSTLTKSSV